MTALTGAATEFSPSGMGLNPSPSGDSTMLNLHHLHAQYTAYAFDLAPRTVQKLRHHVTRFIKHTGVKDAAAITVETFWQFRRNCTDAGLAPQTIEATVRDVRTLLRYAEHEKLIEALPEAGRKLRFIPGIPEQPTIEQFEAMYAAVPKAECRWPKLGCIEPGLFWRVWMATTYFLGTRHDEQARKLFWENYRGEEISFLSRKYRGNLSLPVHPMLAAHLERMPRCGDGRIFPISKSPHLVRREIKRISQAAQVPLDVTPQMLRRLASTEYGKAGGPVCGSLLTGHSMPKRVDAFYMNAQSILQEASRKLYVPKPMEREFPDGCGADAHS